MKRAIRNLIVPAVLFFTLAASAPLAAQEPDTLRMEYRLANYLALEGHKLFKEWQGIMNSKVDMIKDRAERYKKWNEIKSTTAPVLIRTSLSFYRAALMADSTIYWLHHMISYPLNASGDRAGAIAACKKGIELIGDKPNTFYAWLGALYCHDGQKEKALETFKRQILLDPTSEGIYSDTKHYIVMPYTEIDGFTPEEIEEVLSLSKVHKVSKK